jgi:dihydrofolate reductase (trimethoprim resistance protein)
MKPIPFEVLDEIVRRMPGGAAGFAKGWGYYDLVREVEKHHQITGEPRKFSLGDPVRKIKGSCWSGKVVGFYSTELTPEGYAVESFTEKGSVQIYPAAALESIPEGVTNEAVS